MCLVENREFTYQGVVSRIEYLFRATDKSLYSKNDLELVFPKLSNIVQMIDVLVEKNMLKRLDDDRYFFYFLYKSKKLMIEFIFSQFPDGIYLHQQIDFLKDELDLFFPNCFNEINKQRRIITATGNSEKIFLWDWGKYIHLKYITSILEEYDFTKILNFIDEKLEESQIDLKFCFDKFEKELVGIGILNKYALHTCLKLKYTDDYSYQDSPWISKAGTERESLRITLVNLISEDRVYSIEEIMSSMRTTKLRVQQLIDYLDDVIAVDTFKYKHKKFIDFSDDLIHRLIQYANAQVLTLEYFYIELLINTFSDELKKYEHYNLNIVVLELLKKCTHNTNFNISNTRIVHKDYLITRDSLNFHVLIYKLLSARKSISINEISNYFLIRGLSSSLILTYFLNSKRKKIVRLDREIFTSIEQIGISSEDIESINLLIHTNDLSKINLEELILAIKLPKINIPWNRYILADILENEKFLFTPSRENPIYVLKREGLLSPS